MSGTTKHSKSGEVTSFTEEQTGHEWSASQLQSDSETYLEQDEGHGASLVIRTFVFSANPEVFKKKIPSKQELFNSHLSGIEAFLFRDGLKVFPGVEPKLTFNKSYSKYRIWVAAMPSRAILREAPKTLGQILHER